LLGDSALPSTAAVISVERGIERETSFVGDKAVLGVPAIEQGAADCNHLLAIKRQGAADCGEDSEAEPAPTESPTESLDEGDLARSSMEEDEEEDEEEEPEERSHPMLMRGDFRQRYINRLANSRVWVPSPQRSPAHQTVIIFDWDDTLLCTSWLVERTTKCGAATAATAATVAHLAAIEKNAMQMLTDALSLGRTFIITNAVTGWVERSASLWAPQLLPLLRQVQVISARDCFEGAYPDDVDRWKVEAFLEVQRKLPATLVTNLIALGDSEFEMTAARLMREQFEHALLKTVKFLANPTPIALLKQMEVVSQSLGKIVGTAKNMRISLSRRA